MKVSKSLGDNLKYIKDKIDGPKTFDFFNRDFKIAGRDVSLIYVDGLTNGDILVWLLKFLMDIEEEDLSIDFLEKLVQSKLPYTEIDLLDDVDTIIDDVLAGPQVLLIDGEDKAIKIDARGWEMRGPEEPELEKATRGAEDGFIETMVLNVGMVRRRIRDPKLRVEPFKLGSRSKTDVGVLYIDDRVDKDLLKEVKQKLEEADLEGLPLADRTVDDILTGQGINFLPKVRYSNRPDIVAAHLLEGKICVITDNSPTALILPAVFLDHTQNLEEYRYPPLIGSYFKAIRFIAIFLGLILPPLWLLMAYGPDWVPEALEFIGPEEVGQISLGAQFIIATIGIDLIRIASIQTPTALATSLSLIGALILGEFSIEVGLFNPETILYLAIGTIGTFAIPGLEIALFFEIARLILIILVVFLRTPGFIGGVVVIFMLFLFTKSFGIPYLWPLIPFKWKALKTYIFRQSALNLDERRHEESKEDNTRPSE
ncbi:spore germination protein [Halonatronum saccharophilum]|uniref:spore germination protein n=1 Tax=Halonatronum saccharophilum TaxID=150060 RepID=UPI000481A50A|nr:spore germination protein [Halonatronum saccharophilum]